MLVEKDRKVALSYVLVVEGKEVDRAESSNPLEFVYGHGRLLPRFEENIVGLAEGDEFAFGLTPEEGTKYSASSKRYFCDRGEVARGFVANWE